MHIQRMKKFQFLGGSSNHEQSLRSSFLVDAILSGRPVRVERAIIQGDLDLSGVDYEFLLSIVDSTFEGRLNFNEARFRRSLELSGCTFKKSVNLSSVRIGGCLRLDRANILESAEGDAVFDQLRARGHLDCRSINSEVGINFSQARIGGSVRLNGALIRGDVSFEHARISGDFSCIPKESMAPNGITEITRTKIEGELSLLSAIVGHDVLLMGIKVGRSDLPEGEEPGVLSLQEADIKGSISCSSTASHRTEILGALILHRTKVGNQVLLFGAEIGRMLYRNRALNNALVLLRCEIQGGLYCEPFNDFPVEIFGHVYGVSACVSHRMDFDRAVIQGDLDLRRAVVGGTLMCAYDEEWYRKNPDHPSARYQGRIRVRGQLILSGAEIQDFHLDGRVFDEAEEHPRSGLGLLMAELCDNCLVRLKFLFRLLRGQAENFNGESRLRMDGARLVKWKIKHKIPDRINVEGVKLDEVELPSEDLDYVDLLGKMQPFRKSTYLAFESFLRNRGFDEEAKDVYVAMCHRDLPMRRTMGVGGAATRFAKWLFLGVMLGYGTRPLRLIFAILLGLGLSVVLFSMPEALSAIGTSSGQEELCPSSLHGFWSALEVALCCHFPMFSFLEKPACVPSFNGIPLLGITFRHYHLLISILSWVLVPLSLIGLTGLIRQKD